MPFTEHSLFTDPKGNNLKLWRYMDFTKFVSILQTNSLFFPSTRILKSIDPWEGTYLKQELEFIIKDHINRNKQRGLRLIYKDIENQAKSWRNGFEQQIDVNFISCWHYNVTESAAMWRLYLKSNEGIAVQTSIESFKSSFDEYKENVYIGEVRYKDYAKDIFYTDYDLKKIPFPSRNLFLPFIHKRKNYEHEKEYRAIIPIYEDMYSDHRMTVNGVFIPVILDCLIQKIIVAPGSPDWFLDLVRKTVSEYNLEIEIKISIVDDPPFEFDLEPYKNM